MIFARISASAILTLWPIRCNVTESIKERQTFNLPRDREWYKMLKQMTSKPSDNTENNTSNLSLKWMPEKKQAESRDQTKEPQSSPVT